MGAMSPCNSSAPSTALTTSAMIGTASTAVRALHPGTGWGTALLAMWSSSSMCHASMSSMARTNINSSSIRASSITPAASARPRARLLSRRAVSWAASRTLAVSSWRSSVAVALLTNSGSGRPAASAASSKVSAECLMRRRLILRSASKTWATTGWNIAPITPGATPYPASRPAKNPATTWIARPQSRSRSASVISYSSRTATSPSPASESSSSSSAAAWASMSWSSASTAERYRSKLMQRPPARIPASGSTGRPQALPPVRLTGRGPGALVCMDVLAFVTPRGRSSGVKLVLTHPAGRLLCGRARLALADSLAG